MNKQKTTRMALIAVIVILGIAVISLLSNQNKQEVNSPLQNNESLKETYMDGCNYMDGLEDYCSCTYDYIVDNYGVETLAVIGIQLKQGNSMPSEGMEAVKKCKHLIR